MSVPGCVDPKKDTYRVQSKPCLVFKQMIQTRFGSTFSIICFHGRSRWYSWIDWWYCWRRCTFWCKLQYSWRACSSLLTKQLRVAVFLLNFLSPSLMIIRYHIFSREPPSMKAYLQAQWSIKIYVLSNLFYSTGSSQKQCKGNSISPILFVFGMHRKRTPVFSLMKQRPQNMLPTPICSNTKA